MSVVIIGGNDRMQRLYEDTCKKYGCTAKVYIKEKGALRSKIGTPDLLVVFTSTVSHGMRECAELEAKRCNAIIARSHSSSLSALTSIMESHCGRLAQA
ncbi:MAG: DUF2325 domain-containing protein [Oscillospiraceae bacterium]|nr:DUF2325 domain-containing protein [Oscillospiraceae bacterium]